MKPRQGTVVRSIKVGVRKSFVGTVVYINKKPRWYTVIDRDGAMWHRLRTELKAHK